MSTPEHHEVALLLLARARADLSAARLLASDDDQDDGVIGFHAQQASEKAIKAVLAESETEIPRTHDLGYLLELVEGAAIDVPRSLEEPRRPSHGLMGSSHPVDELLIAFPQGGPAVSQTVSPTRQI